MCSGWAFLEALYRAGSRWQVGFDGSDWWSERTGCYPMGEEHATLILERYINPEDGNFDVFRNV
jgi:hypothetical protein